MDNLNSRILEDTRTLIDLYQNNPKFREQFDKWIEANRNIPYRGRPLKVYVETIIRISPQYKNYRQKVKDPEQIRELFQLYYKKSFNELNNALKNNSRPFAVFEISEMREADTATSIEETIQKYENLSEEWGYKPAQILEQPQLGSANIQRILEEKPPIKEKINIEETNNPLKNYRKMTAEDVKINTEPKQKISSVEDLLKLEKVFQANVPIPEAPKIFSTVGQTLETPLANVTSQGSILARKGITGGFKSLGGNIFGGATKGILGGGTKALGGLAGKGAAKGALAASGVATGGVTTVLALLLSSGEIKNILKWAGIALLTLIALPFIFIILQQTSLLPPPGIGESAVLPPGQVSSDISSCKFTRGDQNPKAIAYSSPQLLSYFQEASNKSNIPSLVLAAFTRVESPSLTSYTDNRLASYGCPESETGALGLMQIQPAGTKGHDIGAVTQGALFIGKNYADLTREDYCDMKKNIIMGSGFILKKMSYLGYGDGTKWDPQWTNDKKAIESLVDSYYGCHLYGGSTQCTGPYNYAEDVWESIQNCKVTTAPVPPPTNATALTKILYWGQIINDNLQPGNPLTSFNKMLANITNGTYTATTRSALDRGVGPTGIYWCTNIVIDSYNLTGITGLGPDHQGVRGMMNFWQNTSKYNFIQFNGLGSLKQVRPGFALFRMHPATYVLDHVSIVKKINIDDRGNGSIETIDSNAAKGWTSTIDNSQFTDTSFLAPIVGFGGISQ